MKSLSFITLHPDFIQSYLSFGVMAAAQRQGLCVETIWLRDFAVDKRGSVDDAPYGGGDGMVMRPEPLKAALAGLPAGTKILLPSPSGKLWQHQHCESFAAEEHLAFICGRFAGVDQRFIDRYVDEEFSLGDFVISGGELAALVMADGVMRQCPGVLGNQDSAHRDSFAAGFHGMLEYPLYTRPPVFEGEPVPRVLLSGDHNEIQKWRFQASLERTKERRPDLL